MLAVAAFGLAAAPARAQAGEQDIVVTGTATLVSDYRFRGISLSGGDPALQGGVEVARRGWYAEAWASTLGHSRGPNAELDLSIGRRGQAAGFDYSVHVTGYVFEGEPVYVELHSTLARAIGPATAELELGYAPPQAGVSDNLYLGLALSAPLGHGFALSGRGGIEDSAFFGPKRDWEVGASWSRGPLTLAVSLVGADGARLTRAEGAPTALASVGATW